MHPKKRSGIPRKVRVTLGSRRRCTEPRGPRCDSKRLEIRHDGCASCHRYHAVITEALTAVVHVVIDESQSPNMTYGGRTGTKLQRKSFVTHATRYHTARLHTPHSSSPTPTLVTTTPIH